MGQAWGGFLLKPEEEEKEEEKPEEVPAGKQMLQIPTLPYDGFRLGNQWNMGFNFFSYFNEITKQCLPVIV